MTKIYIPEEIHYNGVTYKEGSVQDVPEALAEYIQNDSRLSKIKPKQQKNKFAHLRFQSLEAIKWQISEYEENLNAQRKQIAIRQQMNDVVPMQWRSNLELTELEFAEFAKYIQPIIEQKEAEESQRRDRVEAAAKSRGAKITWLEDGRYSEHLQPKKVRINY